MNNKHILDAIKAGIRYDGRKPLDFRDVKVEYGISKSAEGSARITFGDTVVLAGVKMSLEKPFPDRPNEGGIVVNAELLPLSSDEFESGPPGIDAIELARVVDRGIRESHSFDLKKLCVEPGEKAWFVAIDICTVNAAGNLLDIAGLAALAAIKDVKYPSMKEGVVDYSEHTEQTLEMEKEPILVTVHKIGDELLVDLISEEEKFSDARLSVTSVDKNTIVAMQKGGNTPLTMEEVDKISLIAIENAEMLRKKL